MICSRERGAGWQRWVTGAVAVSVPAVALYLLTASWPDTPDGLFHLHRVRALAEALRWGVLYPRWFPDFAFGYGYPVLNFYAPAFYYPPALLHLAGLDLIVAVRISLAAWYALSGLAAYALLRYQTRPLPAAVGAVLYLTYPYRLYDLFVRGALPEFAAFLWPPLILLTTIRVVSLKMPGETTNGVGSRWVWVGAAALSWAGLILTHNLTALMVVLAGLGMAPLALIVLFRRGPKMLREQWGRLRRTAHTLLAGAWDLGLPLALGVLLSASYVLPALLETGWVGVGATPETGGYTAHFVTLSEQLDFSLLYRYPVAAQPTVPAPGYVVVLSIAALAALFLPAARGRRASLGISLGIALIALWLGTASSAFVWDGLAPLMGKLQFPWRWQALVALALAWVLAWVLDVGGGPQSATNEVGAVANEDGGSRWPVAHRQTTLVRALAWGFASVLTVYLTLNAFVGLRPAAAAFSSDDLTPAQMWAFDAKHGQVGASWAGEFLPRWVTEQRWAIGREPSGEVRSSVEDRPQRAVIRVLHVESQNYLGERFFYEAFESGRLIFDVFYYPAWRVEVDGQLLPTYPVGDLGLLAVDVPAGQHEVLRRWGTTPAVWAGRAAGAMGWLAILGIIIFYCGRGSLHFRTRRCWFNVGLWVAAAALAVAGGSGWTALERSATPIGADYGSLRLEAAVVSPSRFKDASRSGGTAQVTLFWLVTARPAPLTAFVHLVAPDGRLISGDDASPGGLYTPSDRWQIGELLRDERTLALPDLLPGVYRLMAGVYRAGAPDAPLTPVGGSPDGSRLEVGVLEVRP